MRYRIEFLRESTEEHSVCHTAETEGALEVVEMYALIRADAMKRQFGAEGFQVRDLSDDGRIVALETFDEPLGRFWPAPAHRVIH